jgi:hypothetical protein
LKSQKFINLPVLKRIAAILLIGILSFNWVGYQLLTSYLEGRADKQLEARLDDNRYDESQLLSIKVPSHLSYSSPSLQFERVDGQVEVGGIIYKYVKRRIFNDSLELLCIPNQAAMKLQTAKNNFFQLVNDIQHNGQGKKTDSHPGNSKSPAAPEYLTTHPFLALGDLPFINLLPHAAHGVTALSAVYSLTDEQPPDACFLKA